MALDERSGTRLAIWRSHSSATFARALIMSGPVIPPSLIALSPGDLDEARTEPFLHTISACVSAGLRAVLLREPGLSDAATLLLARALRRRMADGWLALHDRVHLAEACNADAVHLGFRSLAPPVAREILPARIAIGFSAHAQDDADRWAAADHLLFGPVHDTPSKRGVVPSVGFPGLAAAVQRARVPVVAIGGLRPEHAADALAAGASGLAVLSGIVLAPDPPAACARYLEALRAAGRA